MLGNWCGRMVCIPGKVVWTLPRRFFRHVRLLTPSLGFWHLAFFCIRMYCWTDQSWPGIKGHILGIFSFAFFVQQLSETMVFYVLLVSLSQADVLLLFACGFFLL